MSDIIHNLKNFRLRARVSGDAAALYSNIIIDSVGAGLIGLFMPIFLLEKLGSLNKVLFYYFIVHFLYVILIFFGAKIMSIIGQKASMILSVPFRVIYLACFYYLALDFSVLIFIALAVVFIEIKMMLFWVPYHTDFAKFTDKKNRGRVIGFLSALASIIYIFIPFVSGWIITLYGFQVLFLLSLAIIAVSIFPLFFITPTFEKFQFSFRETWQNLFSQKYRRLFFSYFADGMESMVGGIIWPIFIFGLLQGDFLKIGIISSLIVFFTVILNLFSGSFADRFSKKRMIYYSSGFYALGWFLKIFVGTAFQIFIASVYHNFTGILLRTPLDALIYEKAADSGHYVDELTVLREMALNLGRAACLILIALFLIFVGLEYTFILAALASLFINLL